MCDSPVIITVIKGGGGVWILAPEVLSITDYVKIPLLFRERPSLWGYPGDLTQRVKGDQIFALWEDIHLTPPDKVLASVMEAVMNSQPLGMKSNR